MSLTRVAAGYPDDESDIHSAPHAASDPTFGGNGLYSLLECHSGLIVIEVIEAIETIDY